MSAEKLPEGLQLAVKLLDGDRDAFICGQINPVSGLSPNDEVIAAGYLAVIDAIRDEHAQRIADLKDGARFRWLCEDHGDRETREKCRSLIDRLSGMSYSAAVMSIDAAMAAAPEHKV